MRKAIAIAECETTLQFIRKFVRRNQRKGVLRRIEKISFRCGTLQRTDDDNTRRRRIFFYAVVVATVTRRNQGPAKTGNDTHNFSTSTLPPSFQYLVTRPPDQSTKRCQPTTANMSTMFHNVLNWFGPRGTRSGYQTQKTDKFWRDLDYFEVANQEFPMFGKNYAECKIVIYKEVSPGGTNTNKGSLYSNGQKQYTRYVLYWSLEAATAASRTYFFFNSHFLFSQFFRYPMITKSGLIPSVELDEHSEGVPTQYLIKWRLEGQYANDKTIYYASINGIDQHGWQIWDDDVIDAGFKTYMNNRASLNPQEMNYCKDLAATNEIDLHQLLSAQRGPLKIPIDFVRRFRRTIREYFFMLYDTVGCYNSMEATYTFCFYPPTKPCGAHPTAPWTSAADTKGNLSKTTMTEYQTLIAFAKAIRVVFAHAISGSGSVGTVGQFAMTTGKFASIGPIGLSLCLMEVMKDIFGTEMNRVHMDKFVPPIYDLDETHSDENWTQRVTNHFKWLCDTKNSVLFQECLTHSVFSRLLSLLCFTHTNYIKTKEEEMFFGMTHFDQLLQSQWIRRGTHPTVIEEFSNAVNIACGAASLVCQTTNVAHGPAAAAALGTAAANQARQGLPSQQPVISPPVPLAQPTSSLQPGQASSLQPGQALPNTRARPLLPRAGVSAPPSTGFAGGGGPSAGPPSSAGPPVNTFGGGQMGGGTANDLYYDVMGQIQQCRLGFGEYGGSASGIASGTAGPQQQQWTQQQQWQQQQLQQQQEQQRLQQLWQQQQQQQFPQQQQQFPPQQQQLPSQQVDRHILFSGFRNPRPEGMDEELDDDVFDSRKSEENYRNTRRF